MRLIQYLALLTCVASAQLSLSMNGVLRLLESDFKLVDSSSHCVNSTEAKWENERFGLDLKSCASFKAKKSMKGKPNTYFRFNLFIGQYADPLAAGNRIDSLRVKPPGLLPEEIKAYPLRKGFRCGKYAVIVTTGASIFETQLEQIFQKIQLSGCK